MKEVGSRIRSKSVLEEEDVIETGVAWPHRAIQAGKNLWEVRRGNSNGEEVVWRKDTCGIPRKASRGQRRLSLSQTSIPLEEQWLWGSGDAAFSVVSSGLQPCSL